MCIELILKISIKGDRHLNRGSTAYSSNLVKYSNYRSFLSILSVAETTFGDIFYAILGEI